MKVHATEFPEVLLLEPRRFNDTRGWFMEVHNTLAYAQVGVTGAFVQDNFSRSLKGTLRGLHYQEPRGQGKLVQVLRGRVWDVVVDIRRGSPRFGKWLGVELSDQEPRQLWVPPGFAHGFCALTDEVDFLYKCTELYAPTCEATVLWNDPDLAIAWPVEGPKVSDKDAQGKRLRDITLLPSYAP